MRTYKSWKFDNEGLLPPVLVAEGSYADCYNALLALGENLTYNQQADWWEVKPDGGNPTTICVIWWEVKYLTG